jgi:hypothetical protein
MVRQCLGFIETEALLRHRKREVSAGGGEGHSFQRMIMNQNGVLESDWKKFRDSLEAWRERYLESQNARLAAMLVEPGKTPTERFWAVQEETQKQARILRDCLDGESRSRMFIMLLSMRQAGMITKADLADYSEKLREDVFFERRG